jgi:hypothetical protein
METWRKICPIATLEIGQYKLGVASDINTHVTLSHFTKINPVVHGNSTEEK